MKFLNDSDLENVVGGYIVIVKPDKKEVKRFYEYASDRLQEMKPKDFEWTKTRYFVGDDETSEEIGPFKNYTVAKQEAIKRGFSIKTYFQKAFWF